MSGTTTWLAAFGIAVLAHGAAFVGFDSLRSDVLAHVMDSEDRPRVQVALRLQPPPPRPVAQSSRRSEPGPAPAAATDSTPEVSPPVADPSPAAQLTGPHPSLEPPVRHPSPATPTTATFSTVLPTEIPPRALQQPTPVYPLSARRSGLEGVVRCRVEVSASGEVLAVEVVDSSGHRSLDRAARRALQNTPFAPATYRGRSLAGDLVVAVRFVLN